MSETRKLPCPLTDAETLERATRAAKLFEEVAHVEVKRKVTLEAFKEELDHLNGDIRRLSEQVRSRSELREIEVDYRHDEKRGCVETVRCDNFEVISSRPMTSDELRDARQLKIPGVPGVGKAGRRARVPAVDDVPGDQPEHVEK